MFSFYRRRELETDHLCKSSLFLPRDINGSKFFNSWASLGGVNNAEEWDWGWGWVVSTSIRRHHHHENSGVRGPSLQITHSFRPPLISVRAESLPGRTNSPCLFTGSLSLYYSFFHGLPLSFILSRPTTRQILSFMRLVCRESETSWTSPLPNCAIVFFHPQAVQRISNSHRYIICFRCNRKNGIYRSEKYVTFKSCSENILNFQLKNSKPYIL